MYDWMVIDCLSPQYKKYRPAFLASSDFLLSYDDRTLFDKVFSSLGSTASWVYSGCANAHNCLGPTLGR